MKSNTGLHKKIAFIFDGTPTPAQPAASGMPAASVPGGSAAPAQFQPPASACGPEPIPGSGPTRSTSAKPTSKNGARQPKNTSGLSRKQRKTDPRRAKMLILVTILSVVLIVVLFFVLSGPSAPPKKVAAGTSLSNESANAVAPAVPWTRPEPWPEQIRDPMTLGAQSRTTEGMPSECIVRGIVYSQTRSSAIIGDRIVFVGDTLNGITVIAIGKESVEFEKDGQRWTQQVQR